MNEKIRTMVLGLCKNQEWDWKRHITSVVKYSKMLAKKTGADEEVCEVSAWLHDIVKMAGTKEGHHIKGSEKAAGVLKEMGYDKIFIEKVKHCILTHSSDDRYIPGSKEAKIVAAADALSHFDNFENIAHVAFVSRGLSPDEARKFIIKKYDAAWKKVKIVPEAEEIARPKYEAIMLILKEES